ncbi:MAG: transcriptional regulator [Sneathiella sp.]
MEKRDILEKAGQALYGPEWQSKLARALDINVRSVRRWVTGDQNISDGVWNDIARLLTKNLEDVKGALIEVKKIEVKK